MRAVRSNSAFKTLLITVAVHLSLSSASSAGGLVSETIRFKSFETVQICAPLSVLLIPSDVKTAQYTLKIEGESSLLQSVQGRVEAGVLHLEANASFQIQSDAKLTITLPADALRAVILTAASNVYIAPGFQPSVLDLNAASLGGAITAPEIYVNHLSLKANGLASIVVKGAVKKADIRADGGSTIRLSGLESEATVELTGLPTVAISAESSDALIKGTTQGSKVMYSKGRCSVRDGMFGFGVGTCLRDKNMKIIAAPMKWTCQAKSTGAHMCSPSGTSSSAFASTGSDCRLMIDAPVSGQGSVTRTARKLRQSSSTSISSSSSSSTSGGGGTGASTFTYTSNTPTDSGSTSQTICNFVNNVGSCQVNGTPVPVRQYGLGGVPVPAPSEGGEDVLSAAIAAASNSNTQSSASGYASPGGTVCTFVNGIGGCSTG